jgi:predicted GTPase
MTFALIKAGTAYSHAWTATSLPAGKSSISGCACSILRSKQADIAVVMARHIIRAMAGTSDPASKLQICLELSYWSRSQE